MVRLHPGSLEWSVSVSAHASVVRTRTGFNSRTDLFQGQMGRFQREDASACTQAIGVRFPDGSMEKGSWPNASNGTSSAGWKSGFDSQWVH